MDITLSNHNEIQIATLAGDIDANTAPGVTEKILPLVEPGGKILLDLGSVPYMSSAGLRMLLSLYRQGTAQNGKLALVGLSEEIRDTMSVTGFLEFFITCDTLEEGIEQLS
ncbi:MAG: anti-sigma factor antagonist [Cyanobacteriota bacterium]|nr:anti-sigma factor antagonist [Cyanobacteriota bacterium]